MFCLTDCVWCIMHLVVMGKIILRLVSAWEWGEREGGGSGVIQVARGIRCERSGPRECLWRCRLNPVQWRVSQLVLSFSAYLRKCVLSFRYCGKCSSNISPLFLRSLTHIFPLSITVRFCASPRAWKINNIDINMFLV